MVGEICAVLLATFGGNFSRAVRYLLSRDWLEVDAAMMGLYPTMGTPARHPLVAGVGVTADDRGTEAARVELSGVPSAPWAYMLMPGRERRLRVLEEHGPHWREVGMYTARECDLIGRAHVRDRVR